jgi:hypothetical protein
MKNLCLFIAGLLFAHLCLAQTVKNSLYIKHLKGKVKRIESVSYNGDATKGTADTLAPTSKFIELYDENGNEVEESYTDKDNKKVSKWIKKYNEKGEKIEEDYFAETGLQEATTFFKYDAGGKLVESDHEFGPDKTNSNKTLYKYDDRDNNVEEDVYLSGDSLKYKNTYRYDSKGNKIEMDYWRAKEDTIRVKWTFDYNDAGLRVKEDRYSSRGELQIENLFTYENIDNWGNWLLQTRKSQGKNKEYARILSYSVTKIKIYYYSK